MTWRFAIISLIALATAARSVASYGPETDEQRPLHMTFGDDSKISPERIQEWVDPSDEFGMPINWSEGDVGVICNYRSAHGRPDIHLGDGEARKLGVVLGDQYDRVGVRPDKW